MNEFVRNSKPLMIEKISTLFPETSSLGQVIYFIITNNISNTCTDLIQSTSINTLSDT